MAAGCSELVSYGGCGGGDGTRGRREIEFSKSATRGGVAYGAFDVLKMDNLRREGFVERRKIAESNTILPHQSEAPSRG